MCRIAARKARNRDARLMIDRTKKGNFGDIRPIIIVPN